MRWFLRLRWENVLVLVYIEGNERLEGLSLVNYEVEFWDYNVISKFWKGVRIISVKCCREVNKTKYWEKGFELKRCLEGI